MARALLTVAPFDRPQEVTPGEVADQTSTRTTVTLASSAATLRIGYSAIASAVGTLLYVVFNATSNTDANTKLGLAGQRFVIPIGESREFTFGPNALLTRIDIASNTASETGDTIVTYETGVVS
jgi:hypothetical protein